MFYAFEGLHVHTGTRTHIRAILASAMLIAVLSIAVESPVSAQIGAAASSVLALLKASSALLSPRRSGQQLS